MEPREIKSIYIFKDGQLYGRIRNSNLYLLENGIYTLRNDEWNEFLDILPEGVDLEIMRRTFDIKDNKYLFSYIKNPIGNYYFSHSNVPKNEKLKISQLDNEELYFPTIKTYNVLVKEDSLFPTKYTNVEQERIQRLSLSGFQHKLQVSIQNNEVKEDYSNYILKPTNFDYPKLALNEHLHTTFMKELGFEVPFNALVYDERYKEYYYIIKRFDIDDNGKKYPQITLNALMKSPSKYAGNIREICGFLKDKLEDDEKLAFIKYVYANALLFNNDFHKKNISFVFKDNKLKLSPAYDIINTYNLPGLKQTQCTLAISGRLSNIRIKDFQKSIEDLGLDYEITKDKMLQMAKIYLETYPKYIDRLSNITYLQGKKKYCNNLMQTYNKNKRLLKIEFPEEFTQKEEF